MINFNQGYEQYFSDMAKLYGASGSCVITASNWVNDWGLTTADNSRYVDMTVSEGLSAPVRQPVQCCFFGNWSIVIRTTVFAVAGGCGIESAGPPVDGATDPTDNLLFPLASVAAAASAGGIIVTPPTAVFQYLETGFINPLLCRVFGAGNTYLVQIKFDGVKAFWGA